jgi:hypothetical protein
MKWLGVAAASAAIVVGASACGGSSGGFCSTHTCIANFNNGNGYIVQCEDGEWSHSGGEPGACSYHGGEAGGSPSSGGSSDGSSSTGNGSSSAATPNPPTLTWNKQISSIWIGESWNRVEYQWGFKNETGCVLMDEGGFGGCKAQGFLVKYHVRDGYIRVGIFKSRVVYVETNSAHYKTPGGVGVGSAIPFGKQTVLDGNSFLYRPESSSWQTWTKQIPIPGGAKFRPHPNRIFRRWVHAVSQQRGTLLFVTKGVVKDIWIVRGDVNLQL